MRDHHPVDWPLIIFVFSVGLVCGLYIWVLGYLMEPSSPLVPCPKPGSGELVPCAYSLILDGNMVCFIPEYAPSLSRHQCSIYEVYIRD
jgi:hypothetical protein